MSDTEVESLNTVSPLTFKEIVENIKDCAIESVENEDYIGFLTVLDVYLNDWNKYNTEERIVLMELLCDILDENKPMLAEIAWDLPPLLLPFIDCDWPVRFALRDCIQIPLYWKVFNLLTEFGNPKELLLTCCELLGNLKDPEVQNIEESEILEVETALDDSYKLKFDDLDSMVVGYLTNKPLRCLSIKFHVLFQCIKFCNQRIKTIYPSKFLSMIISSILNFFSSANLVAGGLPVQRSIYLFIRDYVPPDIPNDLITNDEITVDELNKIFDDECYLQRKLIRLLFDSLVDKLIRSQNKVFVAKLLPKLTVANLEIGENYFELANRLLSLALSLDISISSAFAKEIKLASSLLDNNINSIKSSEDLLVIIINNYNSSSFRSKTPTSLPISTSSLCFLYMYSKYIEKWNINLPEEITVLDLIKCQLKLFIPYIVNSELTDYTTLSYFMVLTILKIETQKYVALKHDLENEKNKLIIFTYLQNISSIIYKSDVQIVSNLFSRFLLKFLQHLPEDASYSYIFDTLKNCPFDDNVLSVLKIFKNLITTSKFDDENLTDHLSKLKIKDNQKGNESKSLPPILPKRDNYSKSSFIKFSKSKQEDFINLINDWIVVTFDKSEPHKINILKSNRLLSYLNFINSVKFEETEKILSILNNIENSIEISESSTSKDTEQILVVIGLIKFAVNNAKIIYSKK